METLAGPITGRVSPSPRVIGPHISAPRSVRVIGLKILETRLQHNKTIAAHWYLVLGRIENIRFVH